jgi:hypothetical protein
MPGGVTQMEIRIHAPRETDHWVCDYEIDWPTETRRFAGHGADAMQALIIALQMVGAELYTSTAHQDGLLSSIDGEAGYGFPVGPIIRDLLTDRDRAYV